MPWARHATGSDEHTVQVSTEYVVVGETVPHGSELTLVNAFGSVIDRHTNDAGGPTSDTVRWVHDDPDLEVHLDGRPLREQPWSSISDN
jgi:hypothetical protein